MSRKSEARFETEALVKRVRDAVHFTPNLREDVNEVCDQLIESFDHSKKAAKKTKAKAKAKAK